MVKLSASEELKQLNNQIKKDIQSLKKFTKKRRLLLLEDDETDTLIFKEIIRSYDADFEVEHAKDGKEGLQKLNHQPGRYTDIFVDLKMPGMDGFEFLQELQKRMQKSEIEISVLTSSNNTQDIKLVKEIGQNITFIQKPISIDKLYQIFS